VLVKSFRLEDLFSKRKKKSLGDGRPQVGISTKEGKGGEKGSLPWGEESESCGRNGCDDLRLPP